MSVASSFVAQRLAQGGPQVGVYLRPNRHFRLPEAGNTPDRHGRPRHRHRAVPRLPPGRAGAPGDKGRTGCSSATSDASPTIFCTSSSGRGVAGVLTRIDLAFSRDRPEKVYVQHRMGSSVGDLVVDAGGRDLYLCGDATRMAKDVEAALRRIAVDRGGMTDDKAASLARGAHPRAPVPQGRVLRIPIIWPSSAGTSC